MKLDRRGVEYAKTPVTGLPAEPPPLEFSFDDGETWHPAEYTDDATVARILLAGPDATDPGDAVVLELGCHAILTRLVDTPEQVYRDNPSQIIVH